MNQNVIETVKDPGEIQSLTFHLIKSTREEILGIFSTSSAYHRQERAGALALSKEVAKLHNGE